MVKIINPFRMNDWEINKFLAVIFTIQISLLGLIGLEFIGIEVPILRELVAFIYLLFVPGVLILRVLRLHKLSNIETLLYTIGLSIASLMFLGFFINTIYPIFGILRPISLPDLIISITGFVFLLSILSYLFDKDFSSPDFIDFKSLNFIFLCLIPVLAIFGTYLMNYYEINIILMILIIVIAFAVILIAFNKIPKKFYPLTIFIISISLLFHTSLISNYIWGWDINVEYYFANLVVNNGYWNMQVFGNANSMLSIVILAPIFSDICSINLVWVFKIIYPFIFSLIPLGLYHVFKNQTNEKVAFLSTFFFMSIFTFYTEMNQLMKQEIAEIFFILLIMLILNVNMNKTKKSFIFIIFAFSLVVSHYGISYIFILMLLVVISLIHIEKYENLFISKIKGIDVVNKVKIYNGLTFSFIILFVVFALSWYMYTSNSSAFNTIVNIGNHILGSISTDFLNPDTSQGLNSLTVQSTSLLHEIPAYINYLFQFFIVVGLISSLRSRKKFKYEYLVFALVCLFILILSIILPYFASSLNMTRIYHITLFFLAPFAIIGGISLFKIIYKLFKYSWTKKQVDLSLKVISLLLCVNFLFYTGFIYELTGDHPTSFSISKMDDYVFSDEEVYGAEWLHNFKDINPIYADVYRYLLLLEFGFKDYNFPDNLNEIQDHFYLYFGTFNIDNSKLLIQTNYLRFNNTLILNKEKIYDNGGCTICL